eukprot:606150-Prorocentrum_minimum.AAC.1
MEHVLTESRRGPRTYLKPPATKREAPDPCTHHPRTNANSAALAARRRRHRPVSASADSLYEALTRERDATAAKLSQLKQRMEVRFF